ncbi:MAG: hypothetical protein ACLRWP_18530 [Bilophila wadsworthia]
MSPSMEGLPCSPGVSRSGHTLRGIGAVGKALAEKAAFGHVLLSGAVPFSASSPD